MDALIYDITASLRHYFMLRCFVYILIFLRHNSPARLSLQNYTKGGSTMNNQDNRNQNQNKNNQNKNNNNNQNKNDQNKNLNKFNQNK